MTEFLRTRALRVENGRAEVRDVTLDQRPGEATIWVTLSGICNTDLEIARGYAGFEGTIGHEFVGVVEDPGDGDIPRGARVVGEINAGCGECELCDAGDPRHCASRTVLGIVGRDGAHADFVRLPSRNLVRVPDAISDEVAVFVEPLAAACGILERAHVDEASRVAIIGDGKLGLLAAQVLAETVPVTLIGKHHAKLDLLRRGDITTVTVDDARDFARRFDVVVEASGSPEGFDLALALVEPRGVLVMKSTFAGATSVDMARIVVDEIAVVGSRCGRFAPALDLLERGAIDPTPLISEVLSLDEGVRAMERAASPGILKVLLRR